MRSQASISVALVLAVVAAPCCARAAQNTPPTPQNLQDLVARASHAQPREQCFLYAQLVSQMTDLSLRQYAAGDVGRALASLRVIQQFTRKINLSLTSNDKHLRDAEILLSQTTFRLQNLLRSADYQDVPVVQQTLAEVSHAQDRALNQYLHPQ